MKKHLKPLTIQKCMCLTIQYFVSERMTVVDFIYLNVYFQETKSNTWIDPAEQNPHVALVV